MYRDHLLFLLIFIGKNTPIRINTLPIPASIVIFSPKEDSTDNNSANRTKIIVVGYFNSANFFCYIAPCTKSEERCN